MTALTLVGSNKVHLLPAADVSLAGSAQVASQERQRQGVVAELPVQHG